MVKSELKLRDELQIEYQSRINEIERRYEKAFKETTEVCKQQKAELEAQDKKYTTCTQYLTSLHISGNFLD